MTSGNNIEAFNYFLNPKKKKNTSPVFILFHLLFLVNLIFSKPKIKLESSDKQIKI